LTNWLLDTNVLSELRRPKPDPKVAAFVGGLALDQIYVSVVSIAEIRFGIERLADVERRTALRDWLANAVRPMFESRVLPLSEEVILRWRLILEEGRKRRHTFSQPDLFIAATALCHGLTVLSRDTSEFERAKAPVVNPWTTAAE